MGSTAKPFNLPYNNKKKILVIMNKHINTVDLLVTLCFASMSLFMLENYLSLDTVDTGKVTNICRRLNLLDKLVYCIKLLLPYLGVFSDLIFSNRLCNNSNSANNTDSTHSFKSTVYFCTRRTKVNFIFVC